MSMSNDVIWELSDGGLKKGRRLMVVAEAGGRAGGGLIGVVVAGVPIELGFRVCGSGGGGTLVSFSRV
jgi:hypothetical protein